MVFWFGNLIIFKVECYVGFIDYYIIGNVVIGKFNIINNKLG